MPAALALVQAAEVRPSIVVLLVVKRFSVLSPSVSTIMYFVSRGVLAGWASVSGTSWLSAAQAQATPIVTLVLPVATMVPTALFSAVQLLVRSTEVATLNWQKAAGYLVALFVVTPASMAS